MQTASTERPQLHAPKVAIPAERAKQMRLVTRAQALVDQAMADPDAMVVWPAPIREGLSKLTFKQRQFTLQVAGGMPGVHAYRSAYDVDEARDDAGLYQEIRELYTNPRIAPVLLILQDWLGQKWLLDAIEVRDWGVSKLYEEASWSGKASDRIKATELLLRMHGHLVDRKEVIHRDANEMDEQSAIFRSILADVGLSNVLDAEYVQVSQQLAEPSVRPCCIMSKLMAKVSDVMVGDGDGI